MATEDEWSYLLSKPPLLFFLHAGYESLHLTQLMLMQNIWAEQRVRYYWAAGLLLLSQFYVPRHIR